MTGWSDYLDASQAVLADLQAALDPALVERAVGTIVAALAQDRPLLVCGNGGSAADAMHIAGELVGRFHVDRRALKVISLVADSAVLTAWANDIGYEQVFVRQVEAYGETGGVLLALSTSGRSKNVIAAIAAAKAKSMTTIALTGQGGAVIGPLVDILLDVPSTATPLIQQGHLCLYHYICAEVERRIAAVTAKPQR